MSYLNVADARLRQCPYLAASSETIGNCMGNKCMMWRWATVQPTKEDTVGYCGLAGDPYQSIVVATHTAGQDGTYPPIR